MVRTETMGVTSNSRERGYAWPLKGRPQRRVADLRCGGQVAQTARELMEFGMASTNGYSRA